MAEFHYLESFSSPLPLATHPHSMHTHLLSSSSPSSEWIDGPNVFLVTSRSEYVDPCKRSRVPVINALYKVPWNYAATDGSADTARSLALSLTYTHTHTYSNTLCTFISIYTCSHVCKHTSIHICVPLCTQTTHTHTHIANRGDPFIALVEDHWRLSYSDAITQRLLAKFLCFINSSPECLRLH